MVTFLLMQLHFHQAGQNVILNLVDSKPRSPLLPTANILSRVGTTSLLGVFGAYLAQCPVFVRLRQEACSQESNSGE